MCFATRECWKKPPAAFSPFCRAHVLRVRARIPSPVWASIHPVWRRCSSFPYEEYAQSSRLARQASQHPNRGSYSCANPKSTLRASKGLRPCWTDPSERLRACFFEHSLPLTILGSSRAFIGNWREIFNSPNKETQNLNPTLYTNAIPQTDHSRINPKKGWGWKNLHRTNSINFFQTTKYWLSSINSSKY